MWSPGIAQVNGKGADCAYSRAGPQGACRLRRRGRGGEVLPPLPHQRTAVPGRDRNKSKSGLASFNFFFSRRCFLPDLAKFSICFLISMTFGNHLAFPGILTKMINLQKSRKKKHILAKMQQTRAKKKNNAKHRTISRKITDILQT